CKVSVRRGEFRAMLASDRCDLFRMKISGLKRDFAEFFSEKHEVAEEVPLAARSIQHKWGDANRERAVITETVVSLGEVAADHFPKGFIGRLPRERLVHIEHEQCAISMESIGIMNAQMLEIIGMILQAGFLIEELVQHAFRETAVHVA